MDRLKHVAIIMDGNGRWAVERGLPRWKGHEMGLHAVRRMVEAAVSRAIPVVSLFAFSSENWRRPGEEVRILFGLFHRYLIEERGRLLRDGVRISAFGRRDRIPELVRAALVATEALTRECTRLHLRIAIDYGARHEIVETARALARTAIQERLPLEEITESRFADSLPSADIPDPDLIIRTAGEQRLSNFLLWQAAYSELYFSRKHWPDFGESDLDDALASYYSRTRKFGALACGSAL